MVTWTFVLFPLAWSSTWAGFHPTSKTNMFSPQYSPEMRSAYSWTSYTGFQTADSSGPCLLGDWKNFASRWHRWLLLCSINIYRIELFLFCLEQWFSKCGHVTPSSLRDSFTGLMRFSLFPISYLYENGFFFIYSTKIYWSILNTEVNRWLQTSFKLGIFGDLKISKIMSFFSIYFETYIF